MGKYIKLFNTVQEYQAYASDISKFILPNISLCEDENKPYFNPFTGSKILCKYNVTSTESATTLLGNTNNVSSMIVDDAEQEVENSYTFDKTGEHTVLFTLADGVTSIGFEAFKNCTALTSVIIGNSVTSISTAAFQNCSALTSVTIPDSVTRLSIGAFAYCSALTNITIPDSVTIIDNAAFQYCSALTSIIIPDSLTSIGAGAFSYCSALTNITIGNSISYLSNGVFKNCSSLTSITCNATAAPSINNNTFEGVNTGGALIVPIGSTGYNEWMKKDDYYLGKYNWTILEQNQVLCKYNVTSTDIPTTLRTSYGQNIFKSMEIDGEEKEVANSYTFDTTGEHTVLFTLTDGVTSIDTGAFQNCSWLTSIIIGNSVTSIDPGAFVNCSGLTNIIISNSVTSIGSGAFQNCSALTSVIIPDSVTSIGDNAFSGCSGLTNVIIPNSVTSIGAGAFMGCSGLISVTIGNSVTSISASIFANCTGLTSVTIGNSVTSIGLGAFACCSALTSVTIGNSVTSIDGNAFCYCTGLTSIICNATTAPTIQSNTFEGIKSGGTLIVLAGSTGYDVWMGDVYYLGSYNWTILETNQVLCKYNVADTSHPTTLFNSSNNFSSMKVDGEEKEVEKYYTFNSTGEHTVLFTLADGTTSIGNNAFSYCTGLTNVIVPDSVTSIGNEAFYGCNSLTSIVIPDSVTNIDNKAFNNCSGLTSVTIGSGVTSIGESAFQGCSGLTSINIPNSVTSIGNYALEWCDGLTNVIIGSGVTSIGSSVFMGCSSLASITVDSNNTVYDSRNNCNAIIETATNTLISGCKNTVILSDITSIGSSAFGNCSGLTSIVIPDSVTNIGGWAFSNCSGLTSVTIGSSVTSIGECAFQYCSGLTNIVSNAMTAPTIANYTFYNIKIGGTLTVPAGSTGYDAWMSTGDYYLGSYNWTKVEQ